MFWKDHSPEVPGPCSTPGCLESATVRCRECRAKEPTCLKCAARNHRNLPFHWIDIWNGAFFERRDLSDAGFVLYLGHHGDPCPHIPTRSHPVVFVIVHDNGVHSSKVHYCHCPGRLSQLRQLVRSDLFPATLERIETVFTCEVLERFHVDFDVCKRSSQDFVRILNLMSGGTQETGEVKDRYRDFMITSRIYRYLTMVKRSGRRHQVHIPGRNTNDITVPCLTCPIPDFNLPEDWRDIPEHLRYLHRIVLCADGNYSLKKKTKPDDPYDMALCTGQGYIIPHEEMRDYLVTKYHADGGGAAMEPGPEDIPIMCSGFKIPRSQRPGKFKFVDVSGVMSFMCDHLHFRPGATADLQTTETWGHFDYCLAGALNGTEELYERGVSYDVICSCICHILERFKNWKPELLPMIQELKMLLPALHMHAHKELCQIVYAFCYARGFGLGHGEGVETPWAELNIAGLSTREMTAGARHDALTSLFSYWNWQKTCKIGKCSSQHLQL
ncbi:hypothetical protein C8Q73DRAFT_646680 [Cubamyces lactineus]|nr:hypothetical protein C8Q73DRAFT_646680 [Cubamyces lactineus]